MNTDSFLVYTKTEDIYSDIGKDVQTRFDNSNYELGIPLPKRKSKKVTGFMKDELGGKIVTEFAGLRPKTYSYLTDYIDEDKTAKGTKNMP